jgi:hypothetical protein
MTTPDQGIGRGRGSLMARCAFTKRNGGQCGGSLWGLRGGATPTIQPTN